MNKHYPHCGIAALSLLLGLMPLASGQAAITTVGAVTNTTLVATNGFTNAVFDIATGGACEVVPYAPDTFQVRFHWTGLWDKDNIAIARPQADWPSFPISYTDSPSNLVIETDELIVEVWKSPILQVHFKDKSDTFYLLRDDRTEYDTAYNAVADPTYQNLRFTGALPLGFSLKSIKEMPTNEAYFGLGEYAGPMNRRGRNIQGWNADTYSWQEFTNPMYITFPFYYGVQGETPSNPAFSYGVFFNNPARPLFRMGTQWPDRYSFEAGDGQVDYFFFGGGSDHTMKDVLGRYTELTGAPTFLPKWAYGYHQSRWTYSSQAWIEDLPLQFAANDFPLDAIYVDIDYMDIDGNDFYDDETLHQLTFNANFPDPAGMISNTTANGVNLVPILEPWITTGDPNWVEGATLNHFIKNPDKSTHVSPIFFGEVSWIDFSSTPAKDWWKTKVLGFFDQYPFPGVWNDLNEPADNDAIPRDGLWWMDGVYGTNTVDSRRWHLNVKNTLCVRETELSYDILETKFPNQRPFVLSRAGWPGIQRYALGWSGDNVASYDHLRHNIRLGNSVMMSGQVNFGHDIGGFVGSTSGELMTRWHQYGAMNPLCRNHSQKWDIEREPWKFGSPFTELMREAVKLRYELLPYLYTLAYESTQSGVAMNTPTVLHFYDDVLTHFENEYEIMVGDHLLLAPVYVQGALNRIVYLPAGEDWYSWHTGEKFAGGQFVDVPAPLNIMPMFSRDGAIIPRGPAMQHVDAFDPDFLDLLIWPNTNSTFTLYEDDGISTNYTSDLYAKTPFVSQTFSNAWNLSIHSREGNYLPAARDYVAVVHHQPRIESVHMNGQVMPRLANEEAVRSNPGPGWSYHTVSRILVAKFPDTGAHTELQASYQSQLDTDLDLMPDWWEVAHGLSVTNPVDATLDPDSDGLTNALEFAQGTDPNFSDNFNSGGFDTMALAGTFNNWNPAARNMSVVSNFQWAAVQAFDDDSGVQFKFTSNDRWDFQNFGEWDQGDFDTPMQGAADSPGENIQVSNTLTGMYTFTFNSIWPYDYQVRSADTVDSDGDGLLDGFEQYYGLNPFASADGRHDEDGDGLSNSNEFAIGTSPIAWDTDGDGTSDSDELLAGTSPTNAASVFIVNDLDVTPSLDGFQIGWQGVTSRVYEVQFTTSATTSQLWNTLPGATNLSGNGLISTTDTNAHPESVIFYRIEAQTP